ncbi:MAG: hypothetical protein ACOYL6_06985 [Bacteriovoracaceae bacterium]
MKVMIFSLLLMSSLAQASDISDSVKEIIFQEISDQVAFEDEGATRLPQNINDFSYVVEDEFNIRVIGKSYSDWDMKELDYNCLVEVQTRKEITKSEDIIVTCKIQNENWPYWN